MYSYPISRTTLFRLFFVSIPLWGGLVACSLTAPFVSKPTPVPTPSPTQVATVVAISQPTATPMPTPTARANLTQSISFAGIGQEKHFVSSAYGFTITLPITEPITAQWGFIDPAKTDIDGWINKLKNRPNATQIQLLSQLQVANDAAVVMAFLLDVESHEPQRVIPHFNIVVIPRNELSLARYLEEVASKLDQLVGVDVIDARLDYTWRPDGLPTASIRYDIDSHAYSTDDVILTGHQVAFFDRTSENILLGTFVISKESYDEMLPTFRKIITDIRFSTD